MKFLAKMFGLVTKEEFNELDFNTRLIIHEEIEKKSLKLEKQLQDARDFITLYSEVRSDLNRLENKLMKMKPTLTIKDQEAVNFIKDILSKHDNKLNQQHSALSQRMVEMNNIITKSDRATQEAQSASVALKSALLDMNIITPEDRDFAREFFREIIRTKTEEKIASNE